MSDEVCIIQSRVGLTIQAIQPEAAIKVHVERPNSGFKNAPKRQDRTTGEPPMNISAEVFRF
jgi:hypothetical protein